MAQTQIEGDLNFRTRSLGQSASKILALFQQVMPQGFSVQMHTSSQSFTPVSKSSYRENPINVTGYSFMFVLPRDFLQAEDGGPRISSISIFPNDKGYGISIVGLDAYKDQSDSGYLTVSKPTMVELWSYLQDRMSSFIAGMYANLFEKIPNIMKKMVREKYGLSDFKPDETPKVIYRSVNGFKEQVSIEIIYNYIVNRFWKGRGALLKIKADYDGSKRVLQLVVESDRITGSGHGHDYLVSWTQLGAYLEKWALPVVGLLVLRVARQGEIVEIKELEAEEKGWLLREAYFMKNLKKDIEKHATEALRDLRILGSTERRVGGFYKELEKALEKLKAEYTGRNNLELDAVEKEMEYEEATLARYLSRASVELSDLIKKEKWKEAETIIHQIDTALAGVEASLQHLDKIIKQYTSNALELK